VNDRSDEDWNAAEALAFELLLCADTDGDATSKGDDDDDEE
jgi:hypothetical protein